MSFFSELKRRNVFKVGIAYAIVAWLLIQVASTVAPALHLPEWTLSFITLLIIIGFPLAIFLAWAYELTPEGIKTTTSAGPDQYHTQTTGQRLNYFIMGVLVLAVGFLLVDKYVLNETPEIVKETTAPATNAETVASAPTSIEETATAAPPDSIAVLPFTNMSSDPEQEYFADGIAEELLNSLARIKDLEVRGRTSSFYFKGRKEDLHTISKMLNVENIIEGSVRKAGEQVRITVQLINTKTDDHLWSKTYERTMDDIFAIQDDIAKSVAAALQITLGVGELGRAPGMTRNVAAYDAFLAGRSLMRQLSRENVSRAIEQFEKAVALDPDFAIAWAALAGAYGAAGNVFIPERRQELMTKRDAANSRVMAIAPEADFALSTAAQQSGDRVKVERLYKQVLALAPDDFDTNFGYGMFLDNVGRPTEAIDYLQRAVRVEPLAFGAHLQLGIAFELSGNSIAAATEFKQARGLSNQPALANATLMVLALEEKNRALIDEYGALAVAAEAELNPLVSRPGSRNLNQVMLGLLDTPEAAVAELRKFLTDPAYANPFNRNTIAVWASYFGDHELALQINREIGSLSVATWRPIYKPMRRLPDFKEVVTKAGLVDYWRTTGNWGDFCHPVGDDDFECE